MHSSTYCSTSSPDLMVLTLLLYCCRWPRLQLSCHLHSTYLLSFANVSQCQLLLCSVCLYKVVHEKGKLKDFVCFFYVWVGTLKVTSSTFFLIVQSVDIKSPRWNMVEHFPPKDYNSLGSLNVTGKIFFLGQSNPEQLWSTFECTQPIRKDLRLDKSQRPVQWTAPLLYLCCHSIFIQKVLCRFGYSNTTWTNNLVDARKHCQEEVNCEEGLTYSSYCCD